MLELCRTVRFTINPGGSETGRNGFAGRPTPAGLPRFYELDVICAGTPDARTGYLIDIKAIDRAVRDRAVPVVVRAARDRPGVDPAALLPEITRSVGAGLGVPVARLRWRLTPYYSVEMDARETSPARVLIRQSFDFAAAHRLHAPSMSDEENRRLFGACNNPSGHGHNYRVEPCVATPVGPEGAAFGLGELERLTAEQIVSRFDHRHLNEDTEAFATGRGLNPTVENMARVFFDLLAPAIRDACPDAELVSMTVWETDRTSSTYPA